MLPPPRLYWATSKASCPDTGAKSRRNHVQKSDTLPRPNVNSSYPHRRLAEAARNLFAGMRRLDALQLDIILAELLPEEGLGRAINDRLRSTCCLTALSAGNCKILQVTFFPYGIMMNKNNP